MRLVLTTIFMLASGSAFSSSITNLSGSSTQAPSIVEARCPDCPAPAPQPDRSTYHVPALAEGTQTTEIREIGGEKKLVRTEAWLGGSPVVFVSRLADWEKGDPMIAGAPPAPAGAVDKATEQTAPDGLDLSATSAVSLEQAATSPVDETVATLPLTGFDLRLH